MIKGHVQIELHNHKTGSRERIEKDNLVTNAVDKVTSALIGRGQAASTFMPLSTNLLGGVMLFEDALSSNVNNTMFSSSNLLVGYAGQTITTSNKDMGSINSLESGPVTNGYMNVWDFSTSQANGTISSMALTNYRVGDGPLWKPIHIYNLLSGSDAQYSAIDKTDDGITYISEKKIYTKRAPVNYYKITDTSAIVGGNVDTGYTIGDPSASYNNNDWRNGYDGYIYYAKYRTNSGTNQQWIGIEKYDASTYTLDSSFEIYNQYAVGEYIDFSQSRLYRSNLFIRNNKIYVFNHRSDHDAVYVFEYSEISHGHICTKKYVIQDPDLAYSGDSAINYGNNGTGWSRMFVSADEGIWILAVVKNSLKGSGYFKQVFIKESNGTPVVKVYDAIFNGDAAALPYFRFDGVNDIAYYGRYALANIISSNYLGTICNFDSSFEKTDTTTMKVKYTLTNV